MPAVDTYSEAWRHECEVRYVASLPSKQARARYLDGDAHALPPIKSLAAIRGQAAADKLRADAKAYYSAQQAARKTPTAPRLSSGATTRGAASASPAGENSPPVSGSFPLTFAEGPFRRGGCVVSGGGTR